MMLTTFLAIVVLVLLLLAPSYAMLASRAARLAARIPGPPPLPLVGNALEFRHRPVGLLQDLTRMVNKYGFSFRAWIGTYLYVFVADPKNAEIILSSNTNIKKNINYVFLEPWLGTGLLTSNGTKWKHHRKILTPTFHFKILDEFIDVFNSNGSVLVKKLKEKVGVPEFDIYQYITLYTLDVICEAAMGVRMNVQDNKNPEYLSALLRLQHIIIQRGLSPWLFPNFIFRLTSIGREHNACVKILHDTSYKVIANRKAEMELENKKESNTTKDNDIGQKRRLAFLDFLLHYNKDGGNLTDEEIREEVDTFMFEGHDTTSSGLSFCLRMLAEHPHFQEKAYDEQETIFGDSDRDLTADDLSKMKYLETFIKETLRIYPSVPFFFRELVEEVKLDDGSRLLPGTNILITPLYMGRNPEYFPDPEVFNPDRFSAENVRGRHPYLYVPFSAGPRNCIGQKFAMMEMKSAISKILRNFKLSVESKKLVLSYEIVLRVHGGMHVKLENRR